MGVRQMGALRPEKSIRVLPGYDFKRHLGRIQKPLLKGDLIRLAGPVIQPGGKGRSADVPKRIRIQLTRA